MINTATPSVAEIYGGLLADAETVERSIPHLSGFFNRRRARSELNKLRGDISVMERRLGPEVLVNPYIGQKLNSPVKQEVAEEPKLDESALRCEIYDRLEKTFEAAKKRGNHMLVAEVGHALYRLLFDEDQFLSQRAGECYALNDWEGFVRVSSLQREIREDIMPALIEDCQYATDALASKRWGFGGLN